MCWGLYRQIGLHDWIDADRAVIPRRCHTRWGWSLVLGRRGGHSSGGVVVMDMEVGGMR